MGGSISSSLDPLQLALITEEIKNEYQQLQSEGISEEEIKQQLMTKYDQYIKENTQSKPTGGNTQQQQKDSPKKGIRAVPKPKAQSLPIVERRKSFDTKNIASIKKATITAVHSLTSTPENMETCNVTTSSAVTSSATEEVNVMQHTQPEHILVHTVDSWDSVSEQIYCKICQMAFKSLAFLDRHVKYSDVHLKNVKLQENAVNASEEEVVDKLHEKITQKEGVHYKLLYNGAKLFWKTKDNFIIDIFHHIIPHTIEVISFCDVRSKEISRIYLDYSLLSKIVEKEVNEKCKDDVAKHKREKSKIPLDELASIVDARRKAITSTVLSHLQLNVAGEVRTVLFMKSGADNYVDDPVLKMPPDSLIPVSIARKRKTNMDDFIVVMKGLEQDKKALLEATSHAERVINIVANSVKQFASRNAIYARLNPIKKKWFLAVRRVIAQFYVKRYTDLLVDIEKKKKDKESPSPKRRARNSTIYSSKVSRPKEI